MLDGVKNFFSKKILNIISYLVSMTDNVVQMTHHVVIIHEELLIKINSVARNHEAVVQNILMNVESDAYRAVVNSFSRLDFIEVSILSY